MYCHMCMCKECKLAKQCKQCERCKIHGVHFNSVCPEIINRHHGELPPIVALDFDGGLVENKYPAIGDLRNDILERLRAKLEVNPTCRLILWTCRTGKELYEAVKYCESIGLRFDAINDNIAEVKAQPWYDGARKVYANEYWDDAAVRI